ncbi:MAG: hypothetical protein Q8L35_03015 [Actinomycetota bacterium]|nr:hypothetical protein [Actinomycetota bacterium]
MAVVSSEKKIFVAEGTRARIKVFDWNGDPLYSFDAWPKSLSIPRGYPTGLALDDRNHLYVADLRNRDVFVFDEAGSYLYSLKRRGAKLGRPTALTYSHNKLYVSDTSDQTIKVFGLKGKLLESFGGPGMLGGQFNFVTGLAVDGMGRILVADSNNHRVQVLSRTGRFIRDLRPPKGLRFSLPRAVVVDNLSRAYVVDTFNKMGLIFDSDGRYVNSFENADNEDLPTMPNAIAVDSRRRRIVLTDKITGRLSAWEFGE